MSTATPASERLFKFLNEDGTSCHGGRGIWSLPADGQPGDWMPAVRGPLIPCKNGYHLCRVQDLPLWSAPALFEARYRGQRIDAADKIVVRAARLIRRVETWNDRTMRLLACDCAEHVLPIYERSHPGETRVRAAIAIARRFANGQATEDELAAAWAAAAACAVYPAASSAASSTPAGALAGAGYTARAAAETWDTERQWQLDRLMEYLDGQVDLPPFGHCHE